MNKQLALIQEYERLARLPVLSDAQSERTGQILEMAESDEALSEELRKIDLKVNEELGLLDEEHLQYYQDQIARAKEYLGLNFAQLRTVENGDSRPQNRGKLKPIWFKSSDLP